MKNLVTLVFGTILLGLSAYTQDKDQIEVTKLMDSFYKLSCYNAGNTTNTYALTGQDGILLIDGGYPQTANALLDKLESFESGDIEILINTHIHNDHIGINGLLGQKDVTMIAHDNVKRHMLGFQGQLSNISSEEVPNMTFTESLKVQFNNTEVEAIYFPGHSDGDIVVHFQELKIVVMGDLLITTGFPSVETSVGGDIRDFIKTYERILEYFPTETRFLAGHGEEFNYNEMKDYYQLALQTTQAIQKALDAGKSVDEMVDEQILKEWDIFEPGGPTVEYWIGAVAGSVLSEDPKPLIAEPLFKLLTKKGAEDAITLYHDLKANHPDSYDFGERALNLLGYYLLDKERYQDAVGIFKLNTEQYPKASNTYDSLGEAYMMAGDKINAIKNYKESLELDPGNTNANEMIEKMAN